MATGTKLVDALARLPAEEVRELRGYLAGRLSRYDGPYGFTSRNVMVRGGMVNIRDEVPTTITRVRKVLGVRGRG